MKLNRNQVALALASLFGSIHLLWVVSVAAGWADIWLSWALNSHFLVDTSKSIAEFELSTAFWGVVEASVCGYIVGYAFAWFWNYFSKVK